MSCNTPIKTTWQILFYSCKFLITCDRITAKQSVLTLSFSDSYEDSYLAFNSLNKLKCSIDVSMLEKSKEFEEIPDLYLIFITMWDFLKGGKGIYVVERIARGTRLVLDNGVHEFYVNLEVPAEDKDLRALQEYFKHSERNYESKSFPNLANRVNLLKEDKKGVESMSGFAEELRAEGREEGRAEGKTEIVSMVRKKYHKNCTPAQAAEALELDEAYVEKVMKMITENPEATDYDIAFDLVCEKEDK